MPRVLRDGNGDPVVFGGDVVRPPTSIVDDGFVQSTGGEFTDEFADEFDAGPGGSVGTEIADDAGQFIVDDGVSITTMRLAELGPYIPATAVAPVASLAFITASIEASQPTASGVATPLTLATSRNVTPWNVQSLASAGAGGANSIATITASDVGYRSSATDVGGVIPYPPLIVSAYRIDREVDVDPTGVSAGWGWGSLTLSNDDGRFDGLALSWNTDGRAMTLKRGTKSWDDTRGIWLDPPVASLIALFAGMCGPWMLDANTLSVPVRDATYWLEKPYQPNTYAGSGNYEGTAALISTPVPRTRGGTPTYPVKNITPVLVDPVNLIYQYNDGPGTVQAMWEGAKKTYTADGDVSDLYSGSVASGHYRTNNARGLLQLGSTPARAVTLDVTGEFPGAGAKSSLMDIATSLLIEDLGLPTANLDGASFTVAGLAYPYTAGVYFHPDDKVDGTVAVGRLLGSIGAKLIPDRSGRLRCFVLRGVTGTETPQLVIDRTNCASVAPIALPTNVDPPAYRVRVAWQHNYTVQTSDLNPTADATQLQFVASPDTYAGAISAATALKYLRPNDVGPVGGALLVSTDAAAVASALATLWSVRRRLYEVTMPAAVGINADLGDIVHLTYPMDDLRGGRLGQVVGDRYDSTDATIVLRVLI